MRSAHAIRLQVESALARKIPSALTPQPRVIRQVASTGITSLDEVLQGGLPLGALSEVVGPECSGRTSIALSFIARMTQSGKICSWIDVTNALDPLSAAAAGVDLSRLLWVRCGMQAQEDSPRGGSFVLPEKYLVPPKAKKGLHGGGFGSHPRGEAKEMPQALSTLWKPGHAPHSAAQAVPGSQNPLQEDPKPCKARPAANMATPRKPWPRMEQALRSADLLLQAGGFSAIVLDMGSLAPEAVSRVPLATWFRYRAAAERAQSSIVLLSQYTCAKSSAELLLHLQPGEPLREEPTVFTGIRTHAEVARRRFTQEPSNVVSMRKPVQSVPAATWQNRTSWAGPR